MNEISLRFLDFIRWIQFAMETVIDDGESVQISALSCNPIE